MGVAIDIAGILARFDQLPDDALVPDKVAAPVLGMSYHTLRKLNPVPAIKNGTARSFRRVGDIRARVRSATA